ncbi:hypothetical protein HAX54_023250, partial [Datura stramonium]|nr:hypothetical protein [Datura stramonium]
MQVIDERFVRSDKALPNTLMKRLSSMTFERSRTVCEHIMEMRDIIAKLKSLKVNKGQVKVSFAEFLESEGIIALYTMQRTPQQNDVAERRVSICIELPNQVQVALLGLVKNEAQPDSVNPVYNAGELLCQWVPCNMLLRE